MEIRHFVTFKKIVELGSFTKAAENLGYAQSTVTSHIQILEEKLGGRLFDRIGKKVLLTNLGLKLLDYSSELLNVYEKIENISKEGIVPQGVLRIGALGSLTVYRLSMVFKEYKKKYPQVDIFLKTGPGEELKEGLLKGELDIVFLLEPEIDEPDLIAEKLLEEEMAIIYPSDYHLEKEINISNKHTFLFAPNYRKVFENYLEEKGILVQNSMEIEGVETIKRCVISGIGISFLPLFTLQREIKENKISVVPWKFQNKRLMTQIVYHKNKYITSTIESFLRIVRSYIKEWSKVNKL